MQEQPFRCFAKYFWFRLSTSPDPIASSLTSAALTTGLNRLHWQASLFFLGVLTIDSTTFLVYNTENVALCDNRCNWLSSLIVYHKVLP